MHKPIRALKSNACCKAYLLHIGHAITLGAFLFSGSAAAQDLFEIQVYPYDTVPAHHTMVEFHMNYFPRGTKDTANGSFANNHQFHLTVRDYSRTDKIFRAGRLCSDRLCSRGRAEIRGRAHKAAFPSA